MNGIDLIEILLELKHHFNDKTFNWNQKNIILNFFIEKCKNNDIETIKKYKKEKIYELFKNEEINKFLNVLKQHEFSLKNYF